MVARFGVQKDQATLLRALRLLHDNGRRIELLFVGDIDGDGKYLEMNKDLCAELAVGDFVKFLGAQKTSRSFCGNPKFVYFRRTMRACQAL